MRKVLGVLIGIVGFAVAVYVGLWLMFVGGIVQVIDAVQDDPVNGADVAWGVVRIVFASAATAFTFYASLGLAILVGGWASDDRRGAFGRY